MEEQRHLGESRVEMTRLSWAMRGEEQRKGEGREENLVRQSEGPKIQKGQVIR